MTRKELIERGAKIIDELILEYAEAITQLKKAAQGA